MLVNFTKMHGLGNDFMVLDLVRQDAVLDTDHIISLANRKTGIGFDQLLLIEPPTDPSCDFRYRIYNANGGEVEHCGNGARCVARFVSNMGLSGSADLKLQMPTGSIETHIGINGLVTVNMGIPELEPAHIPFNAEIEASIYSVTIPETQQKLEISAVSMGNPHAVILVDSADAAPVQELGPLLEAHRDFPNKVNVGFMEVVNPAKIRLRVFERGVGETLACGTGACAAVVAGQLRNLLEQSVEVELSGGKLTIDWKGGNSPVFMTGPATTVFNGQIEL